MAAVGDDRTSTRVELRGVSRSFGRVRAVFDLDFTIEAGEFFSILGPSGCGKTTTLRLIAGLERPDRGTIVIGDDLVAGGQCWVSPERRAVGIVFQDYALFPHLTVAQNVGFGLKGWSRQAIRLRVAELLALVGLEGLDARYPHELSGGQCQRVALARSLAPAPRVMLLDEPFSNLDADLREELRTQTRRILKERGTTTILVTHEQEEAFALSDRVGVLDRGCLQQVGTPPEIYHRPATRFVADFVGKADFVPGVVGSEGVAAAIGTFPLAGPGWEPGRPVELMIRPDDVDFTVDSEGPASISGVRFLGASVLYELTLPGGLKIHSLKSSTRTVAPGTRVRMNIDAAHVIVFPRECADPQGKGATCCPPV
ncbi:MAG TPA: ABC transporter ATP-binding protein [Bacillota bacterium]|nr:ABC transporter ATP-binding protein [Bacillota bacterium]